MSDDLRADILSAIQSVEDGISPEPIGNETDALPVDDVPPPAIEGAEQPGQRTRDEAGKFKAKPNEAAPKDIEDKAAKTKEAAPTEQAAPKDGEQPAERKAETEIPPPQGWRGSAKVQWNKLPAAVREEISADYKRIGEQEAKYGGLSTVIEPRRQFLTAQYGSVENAVNQLFALSDIAAKEPYKFMAWFAQQRGLDLRHLTPQAESAQTAQHPDATVHALQNQVTTLTNQLTALATQQRQNADAPYLSQVEAFAADTTNNPYFNDVREDMSLLMANGRAKTLKDAYDMACNMRPDIRAQLAIQENERLEADRRNKAAQARAAASSVTGTPIANAATDIPIGNSLREDIMNAMQAHGGLRL